MLVHKLMNEIEVIQEDNIRGFVVDALSDTPEFYGDLSKFIGETKRAVEIAKTMLEVLDASDYVNDIVVSALLLQDITRFYVDDEGDIAEKSIHPLEVRQELLPLISTIGGETFDNILRLVESSHGFNSAIPHVIPSLEDPVYVWILPFANQLAREETA